MDTRIRQAIARIDVVHGGKSGSRGTGFLVAPDLVLTAFHVVADRSAPGVSLYPGQITLTFPTHATPATVVDGLADPRADWILLRCAASPVDVRPIPLTDRVEDAATWETYGFPDANPRDGMVQIGSVENASGTFEGVPAYQLFSRQAAAGTGAPVKGLSGGPVIVDGAIVGLLRSSLMREGQNVAGTLYGCPIALVLDRGGDLLPIPDPCRGLPGLPRRPLPATPFRFLEHFTSADAEIFFGRNREIRALYDRVTSDDGPGVVLLYGQSGAGKSSFLDAGLLPRLESSHSALYLRRDHAKGLLPTLLDAVAPALPALAYATARLTASLAPAEALRMAWLGTETAAGRPLLVVLDQVEEAFTHPTDDPDELASLIAALKQLFQPGSAPRGRLVLGFRKEWFAEIQKQLEALGVDYGKVFLEALDREAVVEIVTGLQHTRRLRERYGVQVEEGLADAIAHDLTADRDSPVAPTLQVLLSRMWREATADSAHAPRLTAALYERLRSEGFLLGDFLDQQLAALAQSAAGAAESRRDVVESGLALDLLAYHTTALGTATERAADDIRTAYRHRADDIDWLVQQLKRLYLLSDPPGDAADRRLAARLCHDTLAQVVRLRFEESDRAGQRARRILENRAGEWSGDREGPPLDGRDLALVEQGLAGMRAVRPDEERLLAASRAARRHEALARARRRVAAGAAVAAVFAAAVVAAWFGLQQRRQLEWRDLLALEARIPTLLRMQPVAALVAGIEAVDRSQTLNRNLVLPGIQEALALALDQARERFSRPLQSPASAAVFSSDGRLAVGTNDGMIELFGAGGSSALAPIRAAGSGVAVRAVAFSSDGTLLAAALGRPGVGVWDRDGTPLLRLPRLPDGIATALRFVPGGHTLVATFTTTGGQTTLYVCDLDRGEATVAEIATRQDITSLATARTSTGVVLVATAGGDIRVWSDAGRPLIQPLEAPTGVAIGAVDLTITPERRVLVAGGALDGTVTVWDVSPDRRTYGPFRSGASVERVAFGHEGRSVVVGGADGYVRVYDLEGDEVMLPFSTAADAVTALAVAPDGSVAAVAAIERGAPRIRIVDMVGGELQSPLPAAPPDGDGRVARVNGLAFPASGTLLVAGHPNATAAWTIEATRGQPWLHSERRPITTRQEEMIGIAADPGGSIVLAGGSIVEFHAGDESSGGVVELPGRARSMALAPDGGTAVIGDEAGGVTLVDVRARSVVRTISAHKGTVWSAAFDADGGRFATGGADGHIRLWQRDGTPDGDIAQPEGTEVTALVFHPSDGTLFTGANNGVVERRDRGGTLLFAERVFRGAGVSLLAVHPSGESVFAAGRGGLRVIDVDTASVMTLPFHGHNDPLLAVAVSPDGRLLAGALDDGRVAMWRMHWREWLWEACNRLRGHEVFDAAARAAGRSSGTQGVDAGAAYNACMRR